jgi:hypothetical protein
MLKGTNLIFKILYPRFLVDLSRCIQNHILYSFCISLEIAKPNRIQLATSTNQLQFIHSLQLIV